MDKQTVDSDKNKMIVLIFLVTLLFLACFCRPEWSMQRHGHKNPDTFLLSLCGQADYNVHRPSMNLWSDDFS